MVNESCEFRALGTDIITKADAPGRSNVCTSMLEMAFFKTFRPLAPSYKRIRDSSADCICVYEGWDCESVTETVIIDGFLQFILMWIIWLSPCNHTDSPLCWNIETALPVFVIMFYYKTELCTWILGKMQWRHEKKNRLTGQYYGVHSFGQQNHDSHMSGHHPES